MTKHKLQPSLSAYSFPAFFLSSLEHLWVDAFTDKGRQGKNISDIYLLFVCINLSVDLPDGPGTSFYENVASGGSRHMLDPGYTLAQTSSRLSGARVARVRKWNEGKKKLASRGRGSGMKRKQK